MHHLHLMTATVAALTATPLVTAGSATFQRLPGAAGANDMTPDGRLVGGDRFNQGYYWTERDGFTMIGGDGAVAVSDDGSVIFGTLSNEDGREEAAVWTAQDDWQLQGGLDTCDFFWTSAYELSGDGGVGVGLAWRGCSGQGFRWTPKTGVVGLEMLANGNNRASVVSSDGSVMAGFAQGSFSRTPAMWFADGTGRTIDPGGDVVGEVQGINDDGTVLLGNWDGDAFFWTEDAGVVRLGSLIPGWVGIAMDVADDGTIVGFDFNQGARKAWIRPPGGPILDLEEYLEANGTGDIPIGLEVAQAISTDGRVIIGHGFSGAWVATLFPAECPEDLDASGAVDFGDILAVLSAWGPCKSCPEDLDGSGAADFGDILVLLAAWGPCP